jgi:lactate permease
VPQRVILAATATGLLGREGDITRAALPPVLASAAILSLIGLVVR